MTEWLDRVAADLQIVEHQVRTALRAIARGHTDPHILPGRGIALNHWQARTLLRGAMPSTIALGPRRHQHARLVAALSTAGLHLIQLNAPIPNSPEAPINAVCDLITEATEWVRLARWEQATKAARVKGWAAPRVAITSIKRLVTPEQAQNAPNASAGRIHHPMNAILYVRQLQQRRQQLDLDLPTPPAAEVIDLRQLTLNLHPTRAA